MEKIRRSWTLCAVVLALCLGSCISTTNELDLDKGVRLDMQIGPGGLYIPLGSLDTLFLDSLIKIDGDNSILDTLDGGLFGFHMSDTIDEVRVEIDSVKIKIDDPEIDPLSTSFEKPEVKDVSIYSTDYSRIRIQKVDLSDINLPSFSKSKTVGPYPITGTGAVIPEQTVVVDPQQMTCDFEYDLPEDVDRLDKIWFGDTKYSRGGQKLTLTIDFSEVYNILTTPQIKISDLRITFPDNFTLAKDPALDSYIPSGCVSIVGSEFRIAMTSDYLTGLKKSNQYKLPVTFYAMNAGFSSYTSGSINFDDDVTYSVIMSIGGQSGNKSGSFRISVDMSSALKMSDVDARTKQKAVDFAKDTLTSSCEVTGLAGISRIDTIVFDDENSLLYLSIGDLDIGGFKLEDDTKIKLTFLENKLTFDQTFCENEKHQVAGAWQTGSVVLLDADKSIGHTVALKAQRLLVEQDVDPEEASIELVSDVEIACDDPDNQIYVKASDDITLYDLSKLEDKILRDTVNGKFVIERSVVETGEKITNFDDTTSISIGAPVDKSLVYISRIDFQPAAMHMNLDFEDVPNGVDTLYFSQFIIDLPDYLRVYYRYNANDLNFDKRISVRDSNDIVINGALDHTELHNTGFMVEGLVLKGMKFADRLYTQNDSIVLDDQNVFIRGDVTVENAKIDDSELKDIIVSPRVSFDSIKVNMVHGLVDPEIERTTQEVALEMGGDADFFKNENNHLSLSDPKITIDLESTVTVPMILSLKLTSVDSKNEEIGSDSAEIYLDPCKLKRSKIRTKLIICKKAPSHIPDVDVKYVEMPNLSSIMERIPDKILFELVPRADQKVEHHVDLTRALAIRGTYDVSIPLAFDSLYIEYSDTIKDLSESLADVADYIDAANLNIVADVESSVPLGVVLKAKGYDKDGNYLPSIEIDSCYIDAGADTVTVGTMTLGMKVHKVGSKSGLSDLDYIVFTAACQSGSESSSIRKGQFLWLKKVRLQIPEGIKVDLTDDKDKKKKK